MISGESQARVWEFIMFSPLTLLYWPRGLYQIPRRGVISPHRHWVSATSTVEQALSSLAFRFKDDVHVIEREARGLTQGPPSEFRSGELKLRC